jgi:hypothetical protein
MQELCGYMGERAGSPFTFEIVYKKSITVEAAKTNQPKPMNQK